MPELPEVETIRVGLTKLIVNKKISSVTEHDSPKSFPNAPEDVKQFMVGATVTDVKRRAKVLVIDLSSGYSLVIHLKMTGQLVYRGEQSFGAGHPNDSLVGELPDRSTRVTITFGDDSKLFFNDQRKFGWIKLLPTVEVPNIDFMQKVGPEPLSDDFTPEQFTTRFTRRKNSNIKAALLDQTVIAGVGNIYADESLFAARIHPETRVKDISEKQFHDLYHAVRGSMFLSIEKGGSTDKNYVNAEGKKGSYLNHASVFRKEGQPCPRCGNEITKMRVAGRGTHVCLNCQPAPADK
jgi:formamidopyrimidine-DNA glycosylase